eukprot:gene3703-6248_t
MAQESPNEEDASTIEKYLEEEAVGLVERIMTNVQQLLADHSAKDKEKDSASSQNNPNQLNRASASSANSEKSIIRPTTAEIRTMSSSVVKNALRSAFQRIAALTSKELIWENAELIIETIIQSWGISDKWKFLILKEEEGSGFIKAKVVWSIPMRRRPVPTATAYTEFYLSQLTDGIDVEWNVEQQYLKHRVEQPCREQWLHDVLASKRLIQEMTDI